MPKGVEHMVSWVAISRPDQMRNSVMPKGVEHMLIVDMVKEAFPECGIQ